MLFGIPVVVRPEMPDGLVWFVSPLSGPLDKRTLMERSTIINCRQAHPTPEVPGESEEEMK